MIASYLNLGLTLTVNFLLSRAPGSSSLMSGMSPINFRQIGLIYFETEEEAWYEQEEKEEVDKLVEVEKMRRRWKRRRRRGNGSKEKKTVDGRG